MLIFMPSIVFTPTGVTIYAQDNQEITISNSPNNSYTCIILNITNFNSSCFGYSSDNIQPYDCRFTPRLYYYPIISETNIQYLDINYQRNTLEPTLLKIDGNITCYSINPIDGMVILELVYNYSVGAKLFLGLGLSYLCVSVIHVLAKIRDRKRNKSRLGENVNLLIELNKKITEHKNDINPPLCEEV